jgi:hypothetical protein
VQALRKKERQDETQFTTKIGWFFEFHPLLNADKLRVLVLCFSYFTDNSIVLGVVGTLKKHGNLHI